MKQKPDKTYKIKTKADSGIIFEVIFNAIWLVLLFVCILVKY